MSLGLTIAGQHLGSTPQSVPEGLIVIHAGNCPVMMLARDIKVPCRSPAESVTPIQGTKEGNVTI